MYKAIATLTDGTREWRVIIQSQYETMQDALDDVKRFTSKGYNVVMIRIEKNPSQANKFNSTEGTINHDKLSHHHKQHIQQPRNNI